MELYQSRLAVQIQVIHRVFGSIFFHAGIVASVILAVVLTSDLCGLAPVSLHVIGMALPCAFLAMLLHDHIRQFNFAHCQMSLNFTVNLIIAISFGGGLCLQLRRGPLTAEGVLTLLAVAYGLGCGVWLVLNRQRLAIDRRAILPDWLMNWSFARWALLSKLVGECSVLVVPWILAGIHGSQDVGVWAACAAIVGAANVFVGGMGRFLNARAPAVFAADGVGALHHLLLWSAMMMVTVLGGLLLVLAIGGNVVLELLYAGNFSGFRPVLMLMAGATLAATSSETQ